ncbi:MAG TPA: leucine--tRNA ligase [Methanospirillum sp.]|uniref:leucine--tRNA ligase n=1 Tax=Methanospirillum sp. TaxID=45200 RepID=UPI002CC5E9CF|nr:leucine--tRNA ligase [Methanospirillum sp.]HWQ64553.1 leucine--tRNA ligase [Methanospirillum sp.]
MTQDTINQEAAVRARWEGAFVTKPSDKQKFYLTVAYPYPSGAMHVGHGRTYIVPDVIARFWRMRGREVLYPMAFHVTGAPVVGISKRIARKDEKAIKLYRDLYRVPQDVLDSFTDPLNIVNHFANEYERVMKQAGLSIDWTRRFTTVEPTYSKFIEWQWKHLNEAGHVVKGAHPVRYCPQDDNPVGDHDLLEGDKAEIQKFILILFKYGDITIPCATLRPETIYGVTNLWVNPDVEYVRANVDGKEWVLSREAMIKLGLQDHEVKELGVIKGSELVDKTVTHPFCGEIPILPAVFVDPDMATGLVMSVPAHAPYDYIALRDLQQKGKYTSIKPIGLIKVDGFGEFPAVEAVEKADIINQDDPNLEALTQEVYSAEHSTGKMYEQYGGKPVKFARDEIGQVLTDKHGSFVMYEFDTRPVVCRCGSRVYVKVLHDQWFLEYSDPAWKKQVYDQLATMELVPSEVRVEFDRTVGWLKDWACSRRVGLGTKMPWDPEWLIEPLSDSTIYMAYYTIAARVKKMNPAILTPEVFDYIFLGKESPDLPERAELDAMRKEFLFWYPYDFRFSAKDLISNHLTFQIFHHCSIFPKNLLPHGMVVFGMGLLNGAKMSSSKGNVYLLEDAINDFGADTVRMFLIGSGEPWQDFDWRNELVASTRKQIERFASTIHEANTAGGSPAPIDRWIISRVQEHIREVTRAMENFQTRQALQEAFFGLESDLKWYRRRLGGDLTGGKEALHEISSTWVRLLAPIIPFTTEELWKEMGHDELISFASWPEADETKIDISAEIGEDLLARTVEDIESLLRIIKMKPQQVTICVSPEWKWEIFKLIASAPDKKNVMREIMQQESVRARGKEAADAVKNCTNHYHRLSSELALQIVESRPDELAVFTAAQKFLENEFNLKFTMVAAENCSHEKAGNALPYKPAIIIE